MGASTRQALQQGRSGILGGLAVPNPVLCLCLPKQAQRQHTTRQNASRNAWARVDVDFDATRDR